MLLYSIAPSYQNYDHRGLKTLWKSAVSQQNIPCLPKNKLDLAQRIHSKVFLCLAGEHAMPTIEQNIGPAKRCAMH